MSEKAKAGAGIEGGTGAGYWSMSLVEFDELTMVLARMQSVALVLGQALEAEGMTEEFVGSAYHVGEMARELRAWCGGGADTGLRKITPRTKRADVA